MSSDSEPTAITKDLEYIPVKVDSSPALLKHIERVERKSFPANEVFDFSTELTKRTTQLFCALNRKEHKLELNDGSLDEVGDTDTLVGYLVIARMKRTALLHKICVVLQYRQKGIGRWMLNKMTEGLGERGCENVQLWVDEARLSARRLYVRCGFEETERVEDYYAPGRTGVKMVLAFD
jgi:ribosomal protein S18 acetylase RimI-like enzyme